MFPSKTIKIPGMVSFQIEICSAVSPSHRHTNGRHAARKQNQILVWVSVVYICYKEAKKKR